MLLRNLPSGSLRNAGPTSLSRTLLCNVAPYLPEAWASRHPVGVGIEARCWCLGQSFPLAWCSLHVAVGLPVGLDVAKYVTYQGDGCRYSGCIHTIPFQRDPLTIVPEVLQQAPLVREPMGHEGTSLQMAMSLLPDNMV